MAKVQQQKKGSSGGRPPSRYGANQRVESLIGKADEIMDLFRRGIATESEIVATSNLLVDAAKAIPGAPGGMLGDKAVLMRNEMDRLKTTGVVNPPRNEAELRARVKQDIAADQATAELKAGTEEIKLRRQQRIDLRKQRMANLSKATRTRLSLMEEPTVFGTRPLNLERPEIKGPLSRLEGETPMRARAIKATMKSAMGGAEAAQQAAGRKARIGRAGLGGLGAMLGIPILKSIFGQKDQGMNPAVQLALAQQMSGQQGGVNTSGTLRDVGKLLTILKGLQDLGSMTGPVAQGPRLI